jgi:hypothetical protein
MLKYRTIPKQFMLSKIETLNSPALLRVRQRFFGKPHYAQYNITTRIFFLLLFISVASYSQPAGKDVSYRSADNPYYWKNRLPFPGYWQQDVAYNIKATVDEQSNIISGDLTLHYFNNSPDTLTFVYFHLYQNAFQPGSYLDNLNRNNNFPVKYGKYESQKKGTVIEQFEVTGTNNNEESYKPELIFDNTILRVNLKHALLPGSEMQFHITFKSFFDNGNVRRRMKIFNASGYKHFDGVHWYPRISVYDRKFGWDTNQHLGREFYGDFGTYDVSIKIANNYVLDGTGDLINEKEVLPDSLRKKLDISNFSDKPLYSTPSVIIPPDGTFKTWRFHAINVHDFAWTADPTYRIGEAEWNGIRCIALAQEPVAAKWQNAASYAAKIIETNSKEIGMYAWPKIIVADARDGMEYPMLTLDGGMDPSYRSLFSHEVGHMWFFGMVGNNETYRALLDEGFTQFLTAYTLSKIEGDSVDNSQLYKWYISKFVLPSTHRYDEVYSRYLSEAIRNEDGFINTHSDMFNGALGHGGGYSQVYFKTAVMLYNLQYVLGDELFLRAMNHYFNQWKMCHPYPEDFRNSMIGFTHVDLNWFFDEWLETNKKIDYAVTDIKKAKEKDQYNIRFKRNGRMQMPIDFSVVANDGSRHEYYIPNTWFVKNTSATVLPKWEGWDKLYPTYTATVTIPGGIHDVVIDTTFRLADINLVNNRKRKPVTLRFDSQIYIPPQWTEYELKARPDLWYNTYDGIKAGLHLQGGYMNYRDLFNLDLWVNTGIGQGTLSEFAITNKFDNASYAFDYTTPLQMFGKNADVKLDARYLDGLMAYAGELEKYSHSKKIKFFAGYKSMYRQNITELEYLLYPDQWRSALYNNTMQAGFEHVYSQNSYHGKTSVILRSSSLGSDYDFSYINIVNINKKTIGKFDLKTRLFLQYTSGSNIPLESSLFLAGANPEEMMENKFVRATGFVPESWRGYGADVNHFQYGGGLNLRGYAGYVAPEKDNSDSIRFIYRGQSGAAINAELDFDRMFGFRPAITRSWLHFDFYLFGDAGVINYNDPSENLKLADIRGDAGIGTALTIKKFGPLETVRPLTLRFDMPLYLSNAPAVNPQNFMFRYVVGINRAF